jgi:hypothetical protein
VTTPPPNSQPLYRRPRILAVIALPILLWIVGLARIAWPHPTLANLSYGLLVAYLIVSFPQVRTSNRVLAGILAIICILLHRGELPFSVVARGLEFAVVFAAFLAVLQFVRATVEALPGAGASRGLFAGMDQVSRRVAVLVSCHLLAVVLSIGAFAIVRPLLPAEEDEEEHRRLAVAALRGVCTAIYWSPFTVGIGFIFFTFPSLPPWQVFGVGMACAVAIVGSAAIAWGGRKSGAALVATVGAFRPILSPLIGATAAVVATVAFSGLSNLQATIVVMPLFCLYQMLKGGRERTWRVTSIAIERMARSGDDMLVFTFAVVLGSILLDSRPALDAMGHMLPAHLPVPVLIGSLCAIGLALGMLGLNAILVGTVLIALAASSAGDLPDMVMALIVLFGWTAASMISFASLAILISGQMFQVDSRRLTWSANVPFLALVGLANTVVLSAVVQALR